jgi:hypothetical protein
MDFVVLSLVWGLSRYRGEKILDRIAKVALAKKARRHGTSAAGAARCQAKS